MQIERKYLLSVASVLISIFVENILKKEVFTAVHLFSAMLLRSRRQFFKSKNNLVGRSISQFCSAVQTTTYA